MLRSMTGFGASALEANGWELEAEVRSVNHRHLLIKIRLPVDLTAFEGDIETLVKEKLERGSVSVIVHAERTGAAHRVEIDETLAQNYQRRIERLARRLGRAERIPLPALLALPGVVAPEERRSVKAGLRRALLRVAGAALERMIEMREAEGRTIQDDLGRHAQAIRDLVERMEKRMPRVLRDHQRSLKRRVEELLNGLQRLEASDLAREIALLADRLDVSEELARIASHLDQLEKYIARGGRVGRQLDFLVQELFREINTVGSKCSDARVAYWVIEAKTHVERLREQVQNLE